MKEIKGEYKGIKKYNFGWYKIESNEQIWLHYKDRKMVICIKRKHFEVLLVCAIGFEYEKMKNSQRQDGRYKVWGVRSWDCELYSRKIEGAI